MPTIQSITYPTSQDPLRGIIPDWILDNTRTEIRVPERNAVG
jgi:hypothetical protein